MASIRFDIRIEDRTEITANGDEISMGMRVIPHVGKPKLVGEQDIRDSLIQQFGKTGFAKRLKMGLKVVP